MTTDRGPFVETGAAQYIAYAIAGEELDTASALIEVALAEGRLPDLTLTVALAAAQALEQHYGPMAPALLAGAINDTKGD